MLAIAPPNRWSPTTPSKRPDFVPADYTELFDHYYPYVAALVVRAGIDYQSAEDVTMAILEKFLSNDVLADYNPAHSTTHDGVNRKALFRTFLSGFVMLYVRHHRDRQYTKGLREPISTDQPVHSASSGGSVQDVSWLEVNEPEYEEGFEEVHTHDLLVSLRKHLATMPRIPDAMNKKLPARCQLDDLFEASLRQSSEFGRPDAAQLAIEFGVSETTLRSRQKLLRIEVDKVFEL